MKKVFMLFVLLCLGLISGCVSLEKMQQDAAKGDETAQVLLGIKYFYGTDDVNFIQYDDARRYFEMAARQENPLACYYLGEIYEKGLGHIDVNSELAETYYKRAAASMKDLPSPLMRHGYLAAAKMYDFGNGVKKDENKAEFYYKRAYNYDVVGSGAASADFLSRTRGALSAKELSHILKDSLKNKDPQARYMYAKVIQKQNPALANTLLQQAADSNYAPAMIAHAELSRNKTYMRSAYRKAAANGCAPAFYELALLEPAEEKRIDLLKKSADRGYVNAVEAMGDYHESRKEWNSAIIYHFMADKIHNKKAPSSASARLERTLGLALAVKSIWENKKIASVSQIGTNINYFIRGFNAGIAKVRENYCKYIAESPESAYINMDYVRIYHANLPMSMAGDIFRIYYNSRHGAVGNDFYLNYAIAAGYAGQGAIQFYAAEQLKLTGKDHVKYHLAKLLLKANALALMGNSNDAYELLLAEYRTNYDDAERNFVLDFVNGNCNMLLKDIKKLSAVLNVTTDKFVLYKERKMQNFYDLEHRTDSDMIAVSEEPEIRKK